MAKDLETVSNLLGTPMAFAVKNIPWARMTFVNCSSIILAFALWKALTNPFANCSSIILSCGLSNAVANPWEILFVISSIAMFFLFLHVVSRLPIETPRVAAGERRMLRVAAWLSLVALTFIPSAIAAAVLPPPIPVIVWAIYGCTCTVATGFYRYFLYCKPRQEYLPSDSNAEGKITAGTISSITNDPVATAGDPELGSAKLRRSTPMVALVKFPLTFPWAAYTTLLLCLCLALVVSYTFARNSRVGSIEVLFAGSSCVMVKSFLDLATSGTSRRAAIELRLLRAIAWNSVMWLMLILTVEATGVVSLADAALAWAVLSSTYGMMMCVCRLYTRYASRASDSNAEKKVASPASDSDADEEKASPARQVSPASDSDAEKKMAAAA